MLELKCDKLVTILQVLHTLPDLYFICLHDKTVSRYNIVYYDGLAIKCNQEILHRLRFEGFISLHLGVNVISP